MKLIATGILLLSLIGCFREGHDRVRTQRHDDGVGRIPEQPGGHHDEQAPVPEPATLALLATGFAALAASRKRKKNENSVP